MKLYEGFFILPPDATGDVQKTQINNLETTIQKFSGKVAQRHELGRRPLGYTLKKFREGYHVVLDFEMDPPTVQELRKNLELQDGLLKYMITVKVIRPEVPGAVKAPVAHAPSHHVPAAPSRAPRRASSPASKPVEKAPVQ